MLEIKNLTYKYENHIALNNINLKIEKGEKIAILGNNGSGKTTFFLCCNGVYKTKNAVSFNGDYEPKTLRRNVGLVFQDTDTQIIGNTVEKEISFGLMNFGFTKEQTKEKIDYAISAMNLEEMRNRPTYYLSGGEKKRVTIADIIALETEIIFFDEPTASLDPANIEKFKNTINKLDKTIVISTHDIDFAYEWADRFIIFNNGNIIADGDYAIFEKNDIIEKANLRKPILWQTMEVMGYKDYSKYPRSIEELRRIEMKKAILVVSFGTSFDETREKTIGAIEKEIAKEFPDYIVKRAFTSGVIMNNLAKRGIIIPNVVTALEELSAQGVIDVFVQPTHIIPGEEYDKLVSMAEGCKDKFGSFKIGKPLMWNENDYKNVSDFLIKEYGDTEKAVILMGHGTEHRANDVYLKLSDILENHNIFVGTVENKPDIYDVLNKTENFKNIVLVPFMVVAGDHAVNDMAGDDDDSWKSVMKNVGRNVEVVLKGVGEYLPIREIYCEHIRREL